AREGDAAVFLFDRLPPRGADRQDRRLRRIDDGGKFAHAVHAEIGDGGGTALVFIRLEPSGARARRHLLHLVRDRRQRLYLRARDERRDQAAVDRDRDGDVATLKAQDAILRPYRIGGGHAPQRGRPCLDDEVVEGELEGGLAVVVLGRSRVGVFAQREKPPDLDVRGQVEMRDGLLRLHQTGGDGRAHAVERHLLERHVAVERLDVFGARPRGDGDAGRRGWAWRGLRRGARGGLDVARPDAAVRTGRRNGGEIDAAFRREPARQRRHASAAREPRRAVIALRRTHLEERIELDRCRRGGLRCGGGRRHGRPPSRGRRGGGRRRPGPRLRPPPPPRRGAAARAVADPGDDGAARRPPARRHADFGEHAGGRRRHLHRHLVGLDLEQVVAGLDGVAGRLEPLRDLAFRHGLAELRHQHVHL